MNKLKNITMNTKTRKSSLIKEISTLSDNQIEQVMDYIQYLKIKSLTEYEIKNNFIKTLKRTRKK